ncbi:hypothetical protein [Fuerstiella marisgermanici]|uniref:Arrestin-like N-terminal domain-containing protein n=1 Tax=Fuerstiella marisgermanici TaxID=1891926 RepID=A0A1P8WNJ3_9PLAN|nr:hypothetical protein [Fuerstiella marisgermanici]APZ95618.1 hypothetical protein Fuma_05277 [Fuerstiella marisgermanici]
MSRCDIQITFDQPDRTYRGGDTVTGEVHIKVNKDIRCNGILLTYYWKTHGRGNTDTGEKKDIVLSEMVPLQSGEELLLPFEFQADAWPLTYRGHYINVDHYVKVAVDVPWAIDPKHEEEFILQAGERPAEITGDRSEIVKLEAKAIEVKGLAKGCLIAFLVVLGLALGPVFIFLGPILLVGAGCYWAWKKAIASRVGDVEFTVPHVVVAPGEQMPVELNFTPKKSFMINGITAKLIAEESATSGSGTNATTHRHKLHEETQVLMPAGVLQGGMEVSESFCVAIPPLEAWSLKAPSNKVNWRIETRIDIPRFPDWKKSTELQVVAAEFLDGESPRIDASNDTDTSSVTAAEDWMDSGPATRRADVPPPIGQSADGESVAPLLTLINGIKQAGRFGNERSEILSAAKGHTYDIDIVVDRVTSTYGFSGETRQHRNGRTITGKLAGTDQPVQLFTVDSSNDSVEHLQRGHSYQTLASVQSWDSLYDRLVLLEVPFE